MRKQSGSNKCILCAKAKRQRQSAQPERKSISRFGDEPVFQHFRIYDDIQYLKRLAFFV
ncbi:hypothetical protein [Lysinibacillus sp. fls2-241-R2A-57]|uniref:hypothetical protein n=1 Tax=Lysinibacillus sp. fls2-241-R2A-57 TaxID=3040292 RepID=UPI0025544E23|nr:hypothetical protein [Lysinibacillus sp. fls2-241-R2A-57]